VLPKLTKPCRTDEVKRWSLRQKAPHKEDVLGDLAHDRGGGSH
jgi:hypothetical protein